MNERLNRYGLHTVCSQARCPNLAECWNSGTATFLILGDTCTRHCRFCSVRTGNPCGNVDRTEPSRLAAAVAELGLGYVVLTSVDRDDLPDLGAELFAETVRSIKEIRTAGRSLVPLVEVLTPEFGGRVELLRLVVEAGPDVFGHNIETVARLSPRVRDPRASYQQSLAVLATLKRLNPALLTKSSLLVGLGETDEEIIQALRDLRSVGCDIVTIGQYLQPAHHCLPVARYLPPAEFAALAEAARALGFRQAFCGPLVRSSYHAAEIASLAAPSTTN